MQLIEDCRGSSRVVALGAICPIRLQRMCKICQTEGNFFQLKISIYLKILIGSILTLEPAHMSQEQT